MNLWKIFKAALLLGCTSFGGPVSHINKFRNMFVASSLSENTPHVTQSDFDEYIAISSILPGPSSSQLGVAIGEKLGGLLGAIVFWLGFTAPSANLMYLVSLIPTYGFTQTAWFSWLVRISLLFIVGKAWFSMAQRSVGNKISAGLVLGTALFTSFVKSPYLGLLWLLAVAILGIFVFRTNAESPKSEHKIHKVKLLVLSVLLIGVFVSIHLFKWKLATSFFDSGLLVFGGGHVVLPLLQNAFVHTGLITQARFNFGYLATQFMPGPIFTFAVFVGSIWSGHPHGLLGGVIALFSIFAPGVLLMLIGIELWNRWSHLNSLKGAVTALNAAMTGLLLVGLLHIL